MGGTRGGGGGHRVKREDYCDGRGSGEMGAASFAINHVTRARGDRHSG